MAKKLRTLQENYCILCEGFTELNYFNGIKKELSASNIHIKIDDIGGGGYSNIIREIQKLGQKNYLAVFVFLTLIRQKKISPKKGSWNI